MHDFKNIKFNKLLSDADLEKAIENIISSAQAIWDLDKIQRFTDHSLDHSARILNYAISMASNINIPLEPDELFYLSAACCLHDIGMQYGHFTKKNPKSGNAVIEWNDIRLAHAEYSVEIMKGLAGDEKISKKLSKMPTSISTAMNSLQKRKIQSEQALAILSAIILAHTKDAQRKETGWALSCKQKEIDSSRVDLLSALVRFADELDLNKERITDFGMFDRMEIPLESLQYWLSSAVISRVDIRKMKSGVLIDIIPNYGAIPDNKELADFAFFLIYNTYKKLVGSLNKTIIPGYPTIGDIFAKYGLSIRVNTLNFSQDYGFLNTITSKKDKYYESLEKVYHRMIKKGFVGDKFTIQLFRFPSTNKKTVVCLVEEYNGLRLPQAFKEQIVKWINTYLSERIPEKIFHTCFHRIGKDRNQLEEYLSDNSYAPHSILGAAAAAKSFSYDIESLELLPSKIECHTQLDGNAVKITFPKFSVPQFQGTAIASYRHWALFPIEYQVSEYKSIIYGLVTTLGDTTFLVIPADQQPMPETEIINELDTMRGAGIIDFFAYPSDTDFKYRSKWRKQREKLIIEVANGFKKQYDIKENLITSIIGYIDEKKNYKVITWRDIKPHFIDHIHVGVIASSYFYLDKDNQKAFMDRPLCIGEELFPSNNTMKVFLWGNDHESSFDIGLSKDKEISITIDVEKSYELRQYENII